MEFNCTTAVSKDNGVSYAWNWLSMLGSPLEAQADGKSCDRTLTNQRRLHHDRNDPISKLLCLHYQCLRFCSSRFKRRARIFKVDRKLQSNVDPSRILGRLNVFSNKHVVVRIQPPIHTWLVTLAPTLSLASLSWSSSSEKLNPATVMKSPITATNLSHTRSLVLLCW